MKAQKGGAPLPRSRASRWARFALALLLIGVAVGLVVVKRDDLEAALQHARAASAFQIMSIVALPAISLLATSASLWLLTLRYGRVGFGEMTALVSSAWLLNHLPMRPGMIGRLAYHKRVNDIAVRDSVRVLIEATVLTGLAAGGLLGAGVMLAIASPAVAWSVIAGAGLLAIGLCFALSARSQKRALLCSAAAVRVVDMLAWSARYALVLDVLGQPLTLTESVVLASASQLAMMVPITGNGLGIREWAVAFLGAGLGVGSLDLVLAADLINRAAELLVAVPAGLIGAALLARKIGRARRSIRAAASPEQSE